MVKYHSIVTHNHSSLLMNEERISTKDKSHKMIFVSRCFVIFHYIFMLPLYLMNITIMVLVVSL